MSGMNLLIHSQASTYNVEIRELIGHFIPHISFNNNEPM